MPWFRREDHRFEDGSGILGPGSSDDSRHAESQASSPPDVAGDAASAEERGFVLLGGSQEGGSIVEMPLRDEGQSIASPGGYLPAIRVPDLLSKDRQEADRLEFQHHLLRSFLRANFFAPIGQPASILDVGCGTGRWAAEMAAQFPMANVIGCDVDLPSGGAGAEALPNNCLLVPANILERLPFADMSFDFVHMRLLFMAIPAAAWTSVVRELVRVTRRGGWIELFEGSLPRNGGPALDLLLYWLNEVSTHRGIDLQLGAQVGAFLHAVSLTNLVTRDISLPVGRYGGRIGRMAAVNTFALLENVRGIVVAQGVASAQKYDHALATARVDIDGDQWRCITPFYLAYGQRP